MRALILGALIATLLLAGLAAASGAVCVPSGGVNGQTFAICPA